MSDVAMQGFILPGIYVTISSDMNIFVSDKCIPVSSLCDAGVTCLGPQMIRGAVCA